MSNATGQWLTTAQAAAWLNITPKTVRRRIERGELDARKASRSGGGLVWLVLIGDETDISTPSSTDAKRTLDAQLNAQSERETLSSTDSGAQPKGQLDGHAKPSSTPSDRVSDLRDEVKFLRGVIEQLQRDGAETRAALREALKSAPKQLTAATSAGDSSESGSGPAQPRRDELDALDVATAGKELTIGDICDQLERDLAARDVKLK